MEESLGVGYWPMPFNSLDSFRGATANNGVLRRSNPNTNSHPNPNPK